MGGKRPTAHDRGRAAYNGRAPIDKPRASLGLRVRSVRGRLDPESPGDGGRLPQFRSRCSALHEARPWTSAAGAPDRDARGRDGRARREGTPRSPATETQPSTIWTTRCHGEDSLRAEASNGVDTPASGVKWETAPRRPCDMRKRRCRARQEASLLHRSAPAPWFEQDKPRAHVLFPGHGSPPPLWDTLAYTRISARDRRTARDGVELWFLTAWSRQPHDGDVSGGSVAATSWGGRHRRPVTLQPVTRSQVTCSQ